ncbi:MAG: hypothetical protein WBB82_15450 [Limnothrix sp.]
MSSTSPYKSKLFNFLNRQSIRWNTSLSQTARRLKITVEWGTQVAAYPFYLLVQSARVATRQIAASKAKEDNKQQAIAAKAKPQKSTDIATEILSLIKITDQPQTLQGIACDLLSQDILFIDAQNQAVQPDQSQESLQKHITFYLADLNYQKHQETLAAIPALPPRILPPVQPQKPKILAPVRWFLKSVSWIERSPVAIAIDLFGESIWRTAVIPPEIYAPPLLPPLSLEPLLNPLDNRVAALEQRLLTPKPLADVPELPPLQRFFQSILHRFVEPPKPDSTLPVVTTPPRKPWLKWTDLFIDQPSVPELPTPEDTSIPALQPTLSPPVMEALIGKTLQQPTEIVGRSPNRKSEAITAFLPDSNGELALSNEQLDQGLAAIVTPSFSETSSIETQSEWIETEALSVGYDQHFLERILKNIDRLMAWMEEKVAKLWSKFRA